MSFNSPMSTEPAASAVSADTDRTSNAVAILDAYWDHVLTEGESPPSVYKFCKDAGIDEKTFFEHFASFETVESRTWERLVTRTTATLDSDPEYGAYSTQQKLLAFYFTILEVALGQRSRLLKAFPDFRVGATPPSLKKFRDAFTGWAEGVVKDGVEADELADRKQLSDRYPDLLFAQLWFLLDYNLKDESEKFQDTDALVEKSVRTFVDAARSQVFDSGFDLLKFLAGRR